MHCGSCPDLHGDRSAVQQLQPIAPCPRPTDHVHENIRNHSFWDVLLSWLPSLCNLRKREAAWNEAAARCLTWQLPPPRVTTLPGTEAQLEPFNTCEWFYSEMEHTTFSWQLVLFPNIIKHLFRKRLTLQQEEVAIHQGGTLWNGWISGKWSQSQKEEKTTIANSPGDRRQWTHMEEPLQTLSKQGIELGCLLPRKHPSHHITTYPRVSEFQKKFDSLWKWTHTKVKASFPPSFSKRDFLVFWLAQWLHKLLFINGHNDY